MFCPNCGKEDLENNKFCMYCGAELIDNQNFDEERPGEQFSQFTQALTPKLKAFASKLKALAVKLAPKAKVLLQKGKALAGTAWQFLKAHKKVSIPAGAVLAVLIVLSLFVNALFTPERTAKNYFRAVVEANADLAYSSVDMVNSPFTGRDAFRAFWQDHYTERELYNYTVTEMETHGGSDEKHPMEYAYNFYYYLRGDSQPHNMTVTVVKDSRRAFLLFDSYKVIPNFIAANYEVVVPAQSTVTLDGVALADPTTEEGADHYSIPALFEGQYELSVSHALGGALTETIHPVSNDVYYCGYLTYSEETRAALYSHALDDLKSIIASALADQETPASVALDPAGDAGEYYTMLRSQMVNVAEGTGFYKFDLAEAADNSYEQGYSASDIRYECELSFRYDYGMLYKRGDGTDSQEDSGSGGAYLMYRYDGTQWLLTYFELYY